MWSNCRRSAEMIRADLEAGGVPYVDDAGRFADFHGLRHTFITRIARAGVTPKVAQTLARHSTITLTMDRYAHVALADQTAALDALPSIEPAGDTHDQQEALAATGTDAGSGQRIAQRAGRPAVQNWSSPGTDRNLELSKFQRRGTLKT